MLRLPKVPVPCLVIVLPLLLAWTEFYAGSGDDHGPARLVRRLSPDFPMHASTQMTITSAAGVEFARDLGCNLVVLARECSIKEIEQIQQTGRSRAGESAVRNESAFSQTPLRIQSRSGKPGRFL